MTQIFRTRLEEPNIGYDKISLAKSRSKDNVLNLFTASSRTKEDWLRSMTVQREQHNVREEDVVVRADIKAEFGYDRNGRGGG